MLPSTRKQAPPRRDSYLASLATIKYRFKRKTNKLTSRCSFTWSGLAVWTGVIVFGVLVLQHSDKQAPIANYMKEQQRFVKNRFERLKEKILHVSQSELGRLETKDQEYIEHEEYVERVDQVLKTVSVTKKPLISTEKPISTNKFTSTTTSTTTPLKLDTPPSYDYTLTDIGFYEVNYDFSTQSEYLPVDEDRDFSIFTNRTKAEHNFDEQRAKQNILEFGFDEVTNRELPLFRRWDLGDREKWVKTTEGIEPVPRIPCKNQYENWRKFETNSSELKNSKTGSFTNPKTTIIICYHDEPWATIVRTIYSAIYSAGSAELIRQVILVDDSSDMVELIEPMRKWVSLWNGRVRLLRAGGRQGLIRARLAGAKAADIGFSDSEKSNLILTFLDAHCECADYWLPPLMNRLNIHPNAFVSPVIDVISTDKFDLFAGNPGGTQVGCFDWKLDFRWFGRPAENNDISPKPSPAMAGGLFSVYRSAFINLGEYDQEMKIWGGENIEMSLRVWMCGGRLEVIPCSHVGHIFRGTNAHSRGLKVGTNVGEESEKNKARTAKVWLDSGDFEVFKSFDNWAEMSLLKIENEGGAKSLEERQMFKKLLKCKSSSWYFENVFPEIWKPNINQIESRSKFGLISNSNTSIEFCIQAQTLHNAVTAVNQCKPGQYASEWYYDFSRKEIRLYSQ